jgi:hypothetical protein
MASAPEDFSETVHPWINPFFALLADIRLDFGQPCDLCGQILVEQFPAEPVGRLFSDDTAPGAIFPFDDKYSFHHISIRVPGCFMA